MVYQNNIASLPNEFIKWLAGRLREVAGGKLYVIIDEIIHTIKRKRKIVWCVMSHQITSSFDDDDMKSHHQLVQ